MADTPGQLPTVTAGTRIGIKLTAAEWCTVIGVGISGITLLIGFVLWLTAMHGDIGDCKTAQEKADLKLEEQAKALKRIEDALREIDLRQRYGIVGIVPANPRATP